MSNRAGYTEDGDDWAFIRWRGAVKSALNGRRGQAFLTEAAQVLEALPSPTLRGDAFEVAGEYCLLGAVGASRGMDVSSMDYEDIEGLANKFGISMAMVQEIMYQNDNCVWHAWDSQEDHGSERWVLMMDWVNEHINLKVKT